jgi:hypothetical protein
MKDGSEYLRDSIHDQLKRGNLKKEYTETHLLEIREYSLRLEKYKNDTVKKIDDLFKEMISTLKKRKNELITEILEKFAYEKNKITREENQWIDKQDITEKLLMFSNDSEDKNLLVNSKFIMDGIRRLNEKLTFKELRIYNDLDTSLKIESGNQNIVLSHEEIIAFLAEYLRIVGPNILEFKS